jgi:hypothetical protein
MTVEQEPVNQEHRSSRAVVLKVDTYRPVVLFADRDEGHSYLLKILGSSPGPTLWSVGAQRRHDLPTVGVSNDYGRTVLAIEPLAEPGHIGFE